MEENDFNNEFSQYASKTRKLFYSSYKERLRQYRAYSRYYRKAEKIYSNNIGEKYSYKAFVSVRKNDYEEAKKLGERPSTYKSLAEEQILTSKKQAITSIKNARSNVRKALSAYNKHEKLNQTQQIMIDEMTEEIQVIGKDGKPVFDKKGKPVMKRVIKDMDWKEYRNKKGVLYETYERFLNVGNFEEDVFGSP